MERKIKVAFIHQPWSIVEPPVKGGDSVTILTDAIARCLSDQCDIIQYSRIGKGQARAEVCDSIEYRRASVSIDRWIKHGMQQLDRKGVRNKFRPFFSSTLCYRQFIGQVINDLAEQHCDIVHIHNFSQFVPLIRSRLPKIKIVLQMHCLWLSELDAAMIEPRLAQADLVLGVSDFIARGARERFPQWAEKCRHVHLGADAGRFCKPGPLPASGKRILYVGRLSPEKGIHILLDAFGLVLKHHPDAHLELIGPESIPPFELMASFCPDPMVQALGPYFAPGAYGQLLREKIAKLPAGRVTLVSENLDHSQLAPRYHDASIFAFPSIIGEAFGMPLVEAMAARVPCVASRWGAFPEVVDDGHTGLLVERNNPSALAEGLIELLSNDSRRREMADAGFERFTSYFTWNQSADRLMHEYDRLLNQLPSPLVGATRSDFNRSRPIVNENRAAKHDLDPDDQESIVEQF